MSKKKTSLISEIVISLVVLMIAATALISMTVLWTTSMQNGPQSFTPIILVIYILVFAIVVAVFGTFFLSNMVVTPLRRLVDATEKISQGQFDARVENDSTNELGQLAGAFNSMAEQLALKQKDLETQLEQLAKINRELSRTQDQLIISEKLASVGKLAAGVAHEIGNPLSIINGYLEMIAKSSQLQEREKDMLGRVDSELKRINLIIRELLDYSRPPSGESGLLDLNQLMTETLKLIEMQKGFHKITPALLLAPDLPAIRANRNQLKQVLVNLYLNALDAMPEGGTLTLKTCVANPNGEVITEISDTGEGIARENLNRIFDPFFTTKDPGKGVGLGLSISLKLIEVMDGKIEFDSELGKGSTFRLRFKAFGGQSD